MERPEDLLQPSLRQDERSVAFAKLTNRLDELPIERLHLYNLDTVIAEALPYLADQFHITGLEGWDLVETEAERRSLIKNAVPLHMLKGTLDGYRAVCRMAKSKLTYWVSPPATTFCGTSMTTEERDRFLEKMPQMRTFRYRIRGKKKSAMLLDAHFGDKIFPAISDAIERLQERAFLRYQDGREVPLITYERYSVSNTGVGATEYVVHLPSRDYGTFCLNQQSAKWRRWVGHFIGRRFLADNNAPSRIYSLVFDKPYTVASDRFRKQVIHPSLDPVKVQFDNVAERGTRRGLFLGDCFPSPNTAPAVG